MEKQNPKISWEQLVLSIILMGLGGMTTWVFSMSAEVAVIKKTVAQVDSLALDQRTAEKMLVLLEAQTQANTDLVVEMKQSQKELAAAVSTLNQTMTEMNARYFHSSVLPLPPANHGQILLGQ